MDKSLARAKHAASRRGRRRFTSHHARSIPGSANAPAAAAAPDSWEDYQDLASLEDLDGQSSRSGALDYAELLSQDPFYRGQEILQGSSMIAFSRGRDPFEDALLDIYATDDRTQQNDSMASLLSLDLDKLSESLSTLSFSQRLALDDETLPSELLSVPDVESPTDDWDKDEIPQTVPVEDDVEVLQAAQLLETRKAADSDKPNVQELDALLDMLDISDKSNKDVDRLLWGADPDKPTVQADSNDDYNAWLDSDKPLVQSESNDDHNAWLDSDKPAVEAQGSDEYNAWLDSLLV